MARTKVKALLPTGAGLALAANQGPHPNTHPVFHLHGMQTQTSWVINGQPYPVGSSYGEMMLLVPFVQIAGSPQWYNFVVRMYLSDWGAVVLGKDFGYRKQLAFVDVAATTFDVTLPDLLNPMQLMPAFHAEHAATSYSTPVPLPHWMTMQSILSMPVVGVDEVTGVRLGSYFHLDFSAASVTPIQCTDTFESAFDPAISAGGMRNPQDGAVNVTGVAWQIDFPAFSL